MTAIPAHDITGVILAGGAGRRMDGRDKGLLPFGGRALVEWVIDALAPQVGALMISANRNLDAYGRYGIPVIRDTEPGFQGPLAGILSAMQRAQTPWILTLPCDVPFAPRNLAHRLGSEIIRQRADLAVATDGARRHNLHALLPRALAPDLVGFLARGERKVELWQRGHRIAQADFSDCPDGFLNLNTLAEAQGAEARIGNQPPLRPDITRRS
ncbi:molybdenum cofactor guanylyltransferase [Thiorhodococcus mannitoliphagus]|uniref:Molybdenum cofactor guanylyltransferase n=1 Tax=Thiorhodococcus mannitoliphagus TaxID=329406 RepID=A0A6P1DQI7_9GAMM|nr:molybdenum cofactor guanylyltransferase MobA [Thiorhodococcus mannitoliphagus]NEX19800.1 molybdenum cofactor guanylyltransferase [Thiorhodococcus mannitoliphagus]